MTAVHINVFYSAARNDWAVVALDENGFQVGEVEKLTRESWQRAKIKTETTA